MWFLKNVPVQGLPLYHKNFCTSWKLTENKIRQIHESSAIHNFPSWLFLFFLEASKNMENCLGQNR